MSPSDRDSSRSDPDGNAEPSERAPSTAARKVILERRARFVAAALAGAGIATSSACDDPQTCLEAPLRTTTVAPASTETEPPPEAGVPSEADAGAQTAASAQSPTKQAVPTATATEPRVCLRPAPPKPPQPCLSVRPPTKPRVQ